MEKCATLVCFGKQIDFIITFTSFKTSKSDL